MAATQMAAAEVDASTPPDTSLSPFQWLRQNLFSSIGNGIISVVILAGGAWLLYQAFQWIADAEFLIVRRNLRNFMVGQFPRDELWRLWASAFVLVFSGAFASGALGRSGYEANLAKDLPAERPTWGELAGRFWAVLAVLAFFVSFSWDVETVLFFADLEDDGHQGTWLPTVGVLVALGLVVLGREIGWRASAAIRARAIYLTAAAFILAMMILAGSSGLGGFCLGLVAAAFATAEMSRREFQLNFGEVDIPEGTGTVATVVLLVVRAVVGFLSRWIIQIGLIAVLWLVGVLIPFDGFGWDDWGGLHVTLFTTVVGITLGMPFGILLALGRRSELPVLKSASVLFIEFVRGVPLISLLLFSNLMLPLFLPVNFDRPADLTLAIIVIMGFSAAYIAEIVRGGLQAVPKGQTEAAQASGMGAWDIQRLIVLPQALRAVIPAMVGQFISLFKDTSLLSIIGILEFLRVSDTSNAQPDFVGKGLASVTYLFVAIGFWAFAYTMSRESRRLEQRLGVGVR